MSEHDMYKVEASRQQLLEEFYQLMVSIDVIGDIKEQLMDEDEMETWGELTVLAGALQTRQPAAPAQPATGGGADAGDGWENAGAYQHRAGAIQWQDGYAAIKQFAENATGKEKDSRFMHETLDAIHSIAAQEIENARKDAATLRTQLADANARVAALERALETIALNSLEKEPTGNEAPAWTYAQAWTLWVVGEHARDALAYKARPTAGE